MDREVVVHVFWLFKMFAHDVKVLGYDVIQVFKGWNHENEKVTITSIQFNDSIDKMVEKEMEQLKAIKVGEFNETN
ncbi:hypothetical protein ACTFSO_11920 [Bacillus cereus group sp. MYBK120-1]|uniref:hypothetical protein n=1 Tax=Bacillus cereus group sp. MYBK120-1 TaxID=3450691 RepID=UPI003F799333